MTAPNLFIGLISGTSMDGIDIVIARIEDRIEPLACSKVDYLTDTKNKLVHLKNNPEISLKELGCLNNQIGQEFAQAVNTTLSEHNISIQDVAAIGSHGQTIFHEPNIKPGFSIQLGNPYIISHETGITTVADFRNQDMALGGQGAPLAPAFHQHQFHSKNTDRFIVNIGGIANLTYLPASESKTPCAWDTGPGNGLMDAWIQKHKQEAFDHSGLWASSGHSNELLLNSLIDDSYFKQEGPKSTGFEKFNLCWVEKSIADYDCSPEDVQATLLSLTVKTIANDLERVSSTPSEIYLCGGGAHNTALISELRNQLNQHKIYTTRELGINPDDVEALCFAWLAKMRLDNIRVPLHHFTGASSSSYSGVIYP